MGFCLIYHIWEGILSSEQVESNSEWLEDWQCSSASEFYISLPVLIGKEV